MRAAILPLALLAGLGACHDPVRDPVYTRCSAVATSDWQARIVPPAQGKSRPGLMVSGRVTLPAASYRVALEAGPVQRLQPPVQQVILRTRPARRGMVEAGVPYEVRQTFELKEGVERVAVRCGDGIVALIPAIERDPPG